MSENDTEQEQPERADNYEEAVYTKPTSQVDLEERLDRDNEVVSTTKTYNPGYGDVEPGNLYLGTNPEYQNHANDTEAPLQADEGPDQLAEEAVLGAYDSRDVKEKARDLDEDQRLDPGDGVSPDPAATAADGRDSVLVAEDPGTGDPVEEEEDQETVTPAQFTGGTTPPNAPGQ